MEILKLLPVGKDYLWGGSRLKEEYGKNIDMTPLAETWECSVHPDGSSIIANGEFAGRTLTEVLLKHPEYLGSKVIPDANGKKQLPVLVKFIDAAKDLSVQVHPDDDYALLNEGQQGKSEMWYVVDAGSDSFIIYGFAHPMTEEKLKKALAEGTLDKHLQKIKVKKGEVYYVPAGTVHGIGTGTLIAEVQENSNVTYRVYDYERLDKDGRRRPLHFDKAIDVMDMGVAPDPVQRPRIVQYQPGSSWELLCRCKYFQAARVRVKGSYTFPVVEASFQVLLCLEGEGEIEIVGDSAENNAVKTEKASGIVEGTSCADVQFHKGDCLFIPAAAGDCRIKGTVEMIKVRC